MKFDRARIRMEFEDAVNMSAPELAEWLKTAESRAVGYKGKTGEREESVGHASGRQIVKILGKASDALSDVDYMHMRKVVGFIRRHRAQRPDNIYTSRWRYSLMNWGYDPVKHDVTAELV